MVDILNQQTAEHLYTKEQSVALIKKFTGSLDFVSSCLKLILLLCFCTLLIILSFKRGVFFNFFFFVDEVYTGE